jgi:uncharacterized protein (TIGR04168 family)
MVSVLDGDQRLKIAVVGDVHNCWEPEDEQALKQLGIDLLLLVGDFGNEAVDVVQMIAAVDIPKAAVLGNHDAWYSATDWGRKKCPYNRDLEDRVQQQLELLGASHVGYDNLNFPEFNLSVVGSRPFSWGGATWKSPEFYNQRYGVRDFADSTARIVKAAQEATSDTIIFIGHCGPTGLGDRPEDPCGKDWPPIGGDHGDPDFAAAIAQTHQLGKVVPLVVFGHMHHQLRHTKAVQRTAVHSHEGCLYLNAACVPRIVQTANGRLRNFSLVQLNAGVVTRASLIWIDEAYQIASEQILYQQSIQDLSETILIKL